MRRCPIFSSIGWTIIVILQWVNLANAPFDRTLPVIRKPGNLIRLNASTLSYSTGRAYIIFAGFPAMAINGFEISSSDPGAVPGASTIFSLGRTHILNLLGAK